MEKYGQSSEPLGEIWFAISELYCFISPAEMVFQFTLCKWNTTALITMGMDVNRSLFHGNMKSH